MTFVTILMNYNNFSVDELLTALKSACANNFYHSRKRVDHLSQMTILLYSPIKKCFSELRKVNQIQQDRRLAE